MQLHDPFGLTDAAAFQVADFTVIDGPRVDLAPNFAITTADPRHYALNEYFWLVRDVERWWTADWNEFSAEYDFANFTEQDLVTYTRMTWPEDVRNFSSADPEECVLSVIFRNTTYDFAETLLGKSHSFYSRVPPITSNVRLGDAHVDLPDPPLSFDTPWPPGPHLVIDDRASSTRRDFTVRQLLDKGQCFPSGTYTWGFSTILLFAFSVWTILTWILILVLRSNGRLRSRSYRYKVPLNRYRDIIDLATELHNGQELGVLEEMSAEELDKLVKRELDVIRLELPVASQ